MLREFLSNKNLIERVLTQEEIISMAEKGRKIHIMMGQTFDAGQPVEMIKYGLFMMNLSDKLSESGAEVYCRWIIADHFMTAINEDKIRVEAEEQARTRIEYLKRINRIYGGNIGFVLSSELSVEKDYVRMLDFLKVAAERDLEFKRKVLESVPEDRRNNPKSINYPLEELAVIESMKTDIKIGPKYEAKYDVPAREFAQIIKIRKFSVIHLRNSYPYGDRDIPADKRKEIEEFGLLPYKLDSKGMGSSRIDPVNGSPEKINALLLTTRDKRALQDMIETCKLAAMKLKKDFNHRVPEDVRGLASLVRDIYSDYIGKYFSHK